MSATDTVQRNFDTQKILRSIGLSNGAAEGKQYYPYQRFLELFTKRITTDPAYAAGNGTAAGYLSPVEFSEFETIFRFFNMQYAILSDRYSVYSDRPLNQPRGAFGANNHSVKAPTKALPLTIAEVRAGTSARNAAAFRLIRMSIGDPLNTVNADGSINQRPTAPFGTLGSQYYNDLLSPLPIRSQIAISVGLLPTQYERFMQLWGWSIYYWNDDNYWKSQLSREEARELEVYFNFFNPYGTAANQYGAIDSKGVEHNLLAERLATLKAKAPLADQADQRELAILSQCYDISGQWKAIDVTTEVDCLERRKAWLTDQKCDGPQWDATCTPIFTAKGLKQVPCESFGNQLLDLNVAVAKPVLITGAIVVGAIATAITGGLLAPAEVGLGSVAAAGTVAAGAGTVVKATTGIDAVGVASSAADALSKGGNVKLLDTLGGLQNQVVGTSFSDISDYVTSAVSDVPSFISDTAADLGNLTAAQVAAGIAGAPPQPAAVAAKPTPALATAQSAAKVAVPGVALLGLAAFLFLRK